MIEPWLNCSFVWGMVTLCLHEVCKSVLDKVEITVFVAGVIKCAVSQWTMCEISVNFGVILQ